MPARSSLLASSSFEPRTLSETIFGEFSRYCLIEFATRFGTVVWMVTDAEAAVDEITGRPGIIRVKDTKEEAIAGLK